MGVPTVQTGLEIRRGYEPGLIGRVSELHGRYYAAAWGSGAPFEILIAREFSEFIAHYDPEKDLVLSAHIDGVLVGSISIIGRHPGPDGVQLRFFLVDPAYHGRGAGKALLSAALSGAASAASRRYSSGRWMSCRNRAACTRKQGFESPSDALTTATRSTATTSRWN